MNNRRTQRINLVPKIEATSPGAITRMKPWHLERAIKMHQYTGENNLGNRITAGPYLVPITRWVE